jgi:hypothetical protein
VEARDGRIDTCSHPAPLPPGARGGGRALAHDLADRSIDLRQAVVEIGDARKS